MANNFKFSRDNYKSRRGLGENPFFHMGSFPVRLAQGIRILSLLEKVLICFFALGALTLFAIEAHKIFYGMTKPVPASGGSYREGMIGDIKYINPVLAVTDNDKAITSLIFSGLVKFDADNNVIPDAAKDWQISEDQETYTFNLKEDVLFHDGQLLTAEDVVYTISRIKELGEKSPLFSSWEGVEVSAPSDKQVVFQLQKPYGPFIYNCGFGILPAHIPDEELSKKPIGSGKMKFVSIKKNKGVVSKVALTRNENYYGTKPLIKNAEFVSIAGDSAAESESLKNNQIDAVVTDGSLNNFNNIYFAQSKKLGLIFNSKDEKLKDKALREKILAGNKFETPLQISLDTIDADLQRSKAEEIKKEFANQNIVLNVNYHKPVAMLDVLAQKKYQLLLYGFDFGRDGDPYLFWHSKQAGQMNYANWENKDTDILLEDARMILDKNQRKAKYDEFYSLIEKEFIVKYYDVAASSLTINNRVKGVDQKFGSDLSSRYNNFENWYVKEKRVKK